MDRAENERETSGPETRASQQNRGVHASGCRNGSTARNGVRNVRFPRAHTPRCPGESGADRPREHGVPSFPRVSMSLVPFPHRDQLAPLPSAAALRAADAATIAAGLAPEVLMETAGRGAARLIRRLWPDARRVQVVCGPGGNGGDGYVLARTLAETGMAVDVVTVVAPSRADTQAMHDALVVLAPSLPGTVRVLAYDGLVSLAGLARPDVRVDALVGTGSRLPLGGPLGEVAAWLATSEIPVLALDLPSGLDADTGATDGPCVTAAATATFAARSPGLLLGDGPAHAGRVSVAPVGVPRGVLDAAIDAEGGAWASTDAWAAAALPRRASDTHKFSAGSVVVVAGSPDYVGAPRLAALAAARSGAGYVRLATDARVADRLADALPTVPVTALPVTGDALDPDAALDALAPHLSRAHALVVGPGLGRAHGTAALVRALLLSTNLPIVVDADALAALDDAWLRAHGRPSWVLTPHTGELARLVGGDTPNLADRPSTARHLAARWNATLVVKGLPSVVGTPEGAAYVGVAHSVGLATAGTGDVLAGMTGAFLAQGRAPAPAALLALHVGGRAAQRYARRHAAASMQATDLVHLLPTVLGRLAA